MKTTVYAVVVIVPLVLSHENVVDQYTRGWLNHTKPIRLGQNSFWISPDSLSAYHLKLGAELAASNLLVKAANLKKRKDHVVNNREGFYIPHMPYMTNYFTCEEDEWCEILVYMLPNEKWIPQYTKTNQKAKAGQVNILRTRSGGLAISHIFKGPASHAAWINQLHWRATGTAKYFSIIGHIGENSRQAIGISVPLTLPSDDPDIFFGYSEN